jgi:hypothetical protein
MPLTRFQIPDGFYLVESFLTEAVGIEQIISILCVSALITS